ncbi:MAG: uracil-DNA glycosylase family protein [Planctomycetota bacterium]
MSASRAAIAAARKLAKAVDTLEFSEPVTHVYNPLRYAWAAHEAYLKRLNPSGVRVLLLGMNPGPWGMAQTGVPFGEVDAVANWLGIDAAIGRPEREHPKRPVEGLACRRSEVSGRRLWGLFRERFANNQAFFAEHFVANYCPLVFMEASGKNRTPDKLAPTERKALGAACDAHLAALLAACQPEWVVGVGRYAEQCLTSVTADGVKVTSVLHPSPASPAANRGWAAAATRQLVDAGVWCDSE